MTDYIKTLLDNNKEWVKEQLAVDENYFKNLALGQHPKALWIGCSDSRVPPNEVTKTHPGELFVHRNVANLVVSTDMNILSVLQYAVEALKVEHIIVCGHYGCGGVRAAIKEEQLGLIDNWLQQIKDTIKFYQDVWKDLPEEQKENKIVELNVVQQVYNLGKTNVVQNAWKSGKGPYLHGWVYDVKTGIINEQNKMINSKEGLEEICKFALIAQY
jgi:carbonic anhydrase